MPKSSNPLLRRKSSSGTSPLKRKSSTPSGREPTERLHDTGLTPSLIPPSIPQDSISLINHILASQFAPIPDRASGMNSERISSILRFREALPPIVSLSHLLALAASPTSMERELARLMTAGLVRKVTIPGRGKGGAAVGEGVVITADWVMRIQQDAGVSEVVGEKYLALLAAHPTSATAAMSTLSPEEVKELVAAGWLTSPTALSSQTTQPESSPFRPPALAKENSIALSGTRAAAGTLEAVGGVSARLTSGGGGNALQTSLSTTSTPSRSRSTHSSQPQTLTFSLPNTGSHLKLLVAARSHLLSLLKALSPVYKEATFEMLKERWEGNVLNDGASRAKRARGEWGGVLPGKTRKWREFFGLRFEWVLGECVGSGLVEVFETGSVGVGIRGI